MRILSMRPEPHGGPVAAFFDLELNDSIRLYGMSLRRVDGALLAFPPQERHGRRAAASFAPELIRQIRELAVDSYHMQGGSSLDERQHNAA